MKPDTIIESVLNPTEHAFCVHGDTMTLWQEAYKVSNPLTGGALGWYRTYGDGVTRHSHEAPVTEALLEDACLSITAYLLRTPNPSFDQSDLDMYRMYNKDSLRFIAGLRTKPTRRWFSTSEQKIGTADRLRHDKRYVEYPTEIQGGSLADCVNLYWTGIDSTGIRSLFRRMHVVFEFAEILGVTGHYEIEQAIGIDCENREVVNAFRGLRAAFDMLYTRDCAMRLLDVATGNINRMKENAEREKRNAALAAA